MQPRETMLVVTLLVSCALAVTGTRRERTEVAHGHRKADTSPDSIPACRYAPTSPWSTCDLQQRTKSKVMTLTHGDPSLCPATKIKTRVCRRLKKRKNKKSKRKGCKYSRSTWGECDRMRGTQEMVLTLRKGNPRLCSLYRTKTRRCLPAQAPEHHHTSPSGPEGLAPPQDLTVLQTDPGDPHSLLLSWQPPRLPHPHLAGYQVEYTPQDIPAHQHWRELQVPSDHLSVRVEGLTPRTSYLFRIAALGSQGPGCRSPVISHTTTSF